MQHLLKAGVPEAFVWKGMFLTKLQRGIEAYEMFQNAVLLGY